MSTVESSPPGSQPRLTNSGKHCTLRAMPEPKTPPIVLAPEDDSNPSQPKPTPETPKAPEAAKPKPAFDSSGNLVVQAAGTLYTFKAPKGKHLDIIQKRAAEDGVFALMAVMCATLCANGKTEEYYYNELDADTLKDLSEAITAGFRVFRTSPV